MLTSTPTPTTHASSSSLTPAPTQSLPSRHSPTTATPNPTQPKKMTLTIPDDVRAKAEIYVGDEAGQEKTRFLLQETGLPSGLLPLRDIIECGYVEETGFVWLRQRRKVDHYFAKAGRHVSYGAEVSAVAEKGRLKKITGVKAKEMLVWVALHEICLDEVAMAEVDERIKGEKKNKDGSKGKLVCKAIGGLSRSFPVDAFEADDHVPAPAASAAGEVVVNRDVVVAEEKNKEEVVKKPEEDDEANKTKQEEEEEGEKKAKEDAVDKDKVEDKLKDLTTKDNAAVQAEAVAAKN